MLLVFNDYLCKNLHCLCKMANQWSPLISVYQKSVYGNDFKDYPIFNEVYALNDSYMAYSWNGIIKVFS